MFPFMGDALFNTGPSTSQTFFSADFPQTLFNFNRSTNPFDAVRQIHQSVDEFMNRTARAFFADFEALSGTSYHRSPAVLSGNDAPVPFHQNRQQWYELNVTRPSERLPPPSASAKRSIDVLDQLPVSVVRVKSATNNSANASKQSALCSKTSGAPTTSDANELNVLNCAEGEQTNAREPGQTEFVLRLDRRKDRPMHPLFPINQLHPTAAGGRPECEICLTEYAAGDRIRHLPCGHLFHIKCIDTWLHTSDTCPKCRKNILFGLRRLHTQHMREQRARAQSLAPTRSPTVSQKDTPTATSSTASAYVGRPASTSRPTELANKRPFNQTRSSILRSQLAEQRRQEASRPPSFPTTRSRRDQPSASATRVSRPVPARRTQTPTSRRASPSGGPRSMTSAHSCPRGQPAGEEAVSRPTTNFVQGQQSSGTAIEEVQIPVTTTNPKESNQRRATTVTGLPTSGSSCSLGPSANSFHQALSEEEKSREARRKAGEAAILRALQADAQSATLAATMQ